MGFTGMGLSGNMSSVPQRLGSKRKAEHTVNAKYLDFVGLTKRQHQKRASAKVKTRQVKIMLVIRACEGNETEGPMGPTQLGQEIIRKPQQAHTSEGRQQRHSPPMYGGTS